MGAFRCTLEVARWLGARLTASAFPALHDTGLHGPHCMVPLWCPLRGSQPGGQRVQEIPQNRTTWLVLECSRWRKNAWDVCLGARWSVDEEGAAVAVFHIVQRLGFAHLVVLCNVRPEEHRSAGMGDGTSRPAALCCSFPRLCVNVLVSCGAP